MTTIGMARIAKIIALLAFLLPWLLVSCAGQPIGTATGADLAMGAIHFQSPGSGTSQTQQGDPDWPLWLALAAIGVGLLASMQANSIAEKKVAGRNLAIAAAAAAVLCIVGLATAYAARDKAMARSSANGGPFADIGRGAAGAIHMETQFGFWVTLLALATAGGLGLAAYRGSDGSNLDIGNLASAIPRLPAEPDDIRYWDRMPNKSDPDALEEYLHRFPDGRFANLAATRLGRMGRDQPPRAYESADEQIARPWEAEHASAERPDASPQAIPRSRFCGDCGAEHEAEARFCSECGSALLREAS
jgi:hypothetical protein